MSEPSLNVPSSNIELPVPSEKELIKSPSNETAPKLTETPIISQQIDETISADETAYTKEILEQTMHLSEERQFTTSGDVSVAKDLEDMISEKFISQ